MLKTTLLSCRYVVRGRGEACDGEQLLRSLALLQHAHVDGGCSKNVRSRSPALMMRTLAVFRATVGRSWSAAWPPCLSSVPTGSAVTAMTYQRRFISFSYSSRVPCIRFAMNTSRLSRIMAQSTLPSIANIYLIDLRRIRGKAKRVKPKDVMGKVIAAHRAEARRAREELDQDDAYTPPLIFLVKTDDSVKQAARRQEQMDAQLDALGAFGEFRVCVLDGIKSRHWMRYLEESPAPENINSAASSPTLSGADSGARDGPTAALTLDAYSDIATDTSATVGGAPEQLQAEPSQSEASRGVNIEMLATAQADVSGGQAEEEADGDKEGEWEEVEVDEEVVDDRADGSDGSAFYASPATADSADATPGTAYSASSSPTTEPVPGTIKDEVQEEASSANVIPSITQPVNAVWAHVRGKLHETRTRLPISADVNESVADMDFPSTMPKIAHEETNLRSEHPEQRQDAGLSPPAEQSWQAAETTPRSHETQQNTTTAALKTEKRKMAPSHRGTTHEKSLMDGGRKDVAVKEVPKPLHRGDASNHGYSATVLPFHRQTNTSVSVPDADAPSSTAAGTRATRSTETTSGSRQGDLEEFDLESLFEDGAKDLNAAGTATVTHDTMDGKSAAASATTAAAPPNASMTLRKGPQDEGQVTEKAPLPTVERSPRLNAVTAAEAAEAGKEENNVSEAASGGSSHPELSGSPENFQQEIQEGEEAQNGIQVEEEPPVAAAAAAATTLDDPAPPPPPPPKPSTPMPVYTGITARLYKAANTIHLSDRAYLDLPSTANVLVIDLLEWDDAHLDAVEAALEQVDPVAGHLLLYPDAYAPKSVAVMMEMSSFRQSCLPFIFVFRTSLSFEKALTIQQRLTDALHVRPALTNVIQQAMVAGQNDRTSVCVLSATESEKGGENPLELPKPRRVTPTASTSTTVARPAVYGALGPRPRLVDAARRIRSAAEAAPVLPAPNSTVKKSSPLLRDNDMDNTETASSNDRSDDAVQRLWDLLNSASPGVPSAPSRIDGEKMEEPPRGLEAKGKGADDASAQQQRPGMGVPTVKPRAMMMSRSNGRALMKGRGELFNPRAADSPVQQVARAVEKAPVTSSRVADAPPAPHSISSAAATSGQRSSPGITQDDGPLRGSPATSLYPERDISLSEEDGAAGVAPSLIRHGLFNFGAVKFGKDNHYEAVPLSRQRTGQRSWRMRRGLDDVADDEGWIDPSTGAAGVAEDFGIPMTPEVPRATPCEKDGDDFSDEDIAKIEEEIIVEQLRKATMKENRALKRQAARQAALAAREPPRKPSPVADISKQHAVAAPMSEKLKKGKASRHRRHPAYANGTEAENSDAVRARERAEDAAVESFINSMYPTKAKKAVTAHEKTMSKMAGLHKAHKRLKSAMKQGA